MKTQEEIEQLAKDFADDAHGSPTATFLEKGFIHGYTQCQEDMVDVMGNFLEYVRDNYTGMGAPHLVHNKGGQRKTKAIVEDFINSLNKQD